jgi:SMODS-associated NUDIX domain
MNFLKAVGENLVADVIWISIVSLVVARSVFRTAALPVLHMTVRRRSPIRFSASSLLRVKSGSCYVLTITEARGESPPYWGPLGGVIKCRSETLKSLYDLDVQTDWLPESSGDMHRDLRVKMRGSRFLRFMRWYWSGDARESPSEALARELKEELGDLGLQSLVACVDQLEFNVCPAKAAKLYREDGLYHYRLFYVLDLTGPAATGFEAELLSSLIPDKLALIQEDDIRLGRHRGVAVGGHSAFLIPGEKYRHRPQSYQ